MESAQKQDSSERFTLGTLITAFQSSESAFEANMDVARRYAAQGSPAALWWRIQAGLLRFHPDRDSIAGVDELNAVCNVTFGSGLTLENLRRIHGRLCLESGLARKEVDQLPLEKAAQQFRKIAIDTRIAPNMQNSKRSALETWKEKLEYLHEQEAITADPAQKFALKKQIEEAREKIRELGG